MASTMRLEASPPLIVRDRGWPGFGHEAGKLAAFQVAIDDTQSLSSLIESEIIPRLLVAHATMAPAVARANGGSPKTTSLIDGAEIEALGVLVMQVEADVVLAHIEGILARGITVDSVMVDLMAPTARFLGELWEDDRCDFVDVTMGLWRLQEVVHEIAARFPADRAHVLGGHRALFAAMPGDQHNFGTVVIDEVFRRDGWITDRLGDVETAELLKRVADDWFDIVGLTISCDAHTATLPSLIAALRNVSRNPQLCIMVGGRVFNAAPHLARQLGADGTAVDAKVALQVAAKLVRERERETAVHN